MKTWNTVSRKWRGALSPAVIGAAMALAACGGGGVTSPPADDDGGASVDATPYALFASNTATLGGQSAINALSPGRAMLPPE